MAGTLYVVATPIGNLEDVTGRALRVLREADAIAAEDTRVTRKLLARYEIHTPLTAYHAHSGPGRVAALVERLLAGETLALVSDAGTPTVSDPGGELVRAAIEAGVRVVPIPGPSALLAALSAGGLDPSRFVFAGFLPRSPGDRRRTLAPLAALPFTLIFFESAPRLAGTLAALRASLGDRPAVVARELTKTFEEFARGTLAELEARYREQPPRGECVLLVEGARGGSPAEPSGEELDACIRERLAAGASVRDLSRELATEFRVPRGRVYERARLLAEARDRED